MLTIVTRSFYIFALPIIIFCFLPMKKYKGMPIGAARIKTSNHIILLFPENSFLTMSTKHTIASTGIARNNNIIGNINTAYGLPIVPPKLNTIMHTQKFMIYLSKIRTEVNKNHEIGTHSLCLYCLIFCFGLFLQPLMDVFQTFLRTVQYGKSPTGLSGGLSVSGGGMRYETLALTCLK